MVNINQIIILFGQPGTKLHVLLVDALFPPLQGRKQLVRIALIPVGMVNQLLFYFLQPFNEHMVLFLIMVYIRFMHWFFSVAELDASIFLLVEVGVGLPFRI